MSRYNFKHKDVSYVVGWDNPLHTFFAQQYSPTEDDYIDLGEWDSIKDIPLVIPDGIMSRLTEDYDNRTEPTPLQKMMVEYAKKYLER